MPTIEPAASPSRSGAILALILRAEGGAVFLIALAVYAHLGASWWLFLALILAPDLALLGYLRDDRTGAWAYNAAHTYLGAALLGTVGYLAGWPVLVAAAVVWAAHIGVDRLLAYGLKYPASRQENHLTRLART